VGKVQPSVDLIKGLGDKVFSYVNARSSALKAQMKLGDRTAEEDTQPMYVLKETSQKTQSRRNL